MLSILKDIPSFALTCELDDFTIMSDKTVTIQINQLGRQLFSASYVPDANNEIHFRDLCNIVESYLADEPLQKFSYVVSASSENSISKDFDVLMCRYDVSDDGSEFIKSHFLTSLDGRKFIGPHSTEFLYFTSGSTVALPTDSVYVHCVYVTTSNEVVTEDKLVSHAAVVGINKLDVSPSQFNKTDMTLVRYTITCGARKMRYDIFERNTAASIRFKNNFGCVETFTFSGTIEVNPKIERSSALVNGSRINYDIRKEVHYKCYSSYIPNEMFYFADDIAASDDVSLIAQNQKYAVAIVESDTPRSNSSSALNSFWIEIVSASRKGFRLPELTRIFDDTFDETYN